jgi:ribosome-associated translation inhibitor RaiA
MIIQFNTDKTIHASSSLTKEVEASVHSSLSHFEEHISRVEVHLIDENGAKSGGNDIRCTMEARPKGHQPVAVTHHASDLSDALHGAADKLKSALGHTLGRIKEKHG